MPAELVKLLAKKTGKSVEEVEAKWKKIKFGVSKSIPESDPKFYAVVVATLKKSLENS
jgi:hypothetical protein